MRAPNFHAPIHPTGPSPEAPIGCIFISALALSPFSWPSPENSLKHIDTIVKIWYSMVSYVPIFIT